MPIRISFFTKVFHFGFKARTSRGPMADKKSWFIRMEDDQQPGIVGLGECGPLPGLSIDHSPTFEDDLRRVVESLNEAGLTTADYNRIYEIIPPEMSSVLFGVETALLDLSKGGKRILFDNAFQTGMRIPINGLIWMGDLDFMMDQINKKIAQGFRCIKIKVGGLDFERECDVLHYIRRRYFRDNIELRLDANGAFKIDDALYRLEELSQFDIHSIEQPIKRGLPEMEELCRKSPIPVALDEELIGVNGTATRKNLLEKLKPQFIVLKPTLHGGIRGCQEWIELAGATNTGWWITSSLESSIGLNAICQLTAEYDLTLPQGLGTGGIYTDNFASPLTVEKGNIFLDNTKYWDLPEGIN